MKKTYKGEIKLKRSLMQQLKYKKADQPYFTEMVERFMNLWRFSIDLEDDIKSRGVSFLDSSASGVEMWKNNPSIKDLKATTDQMQKIISQLGLTTNNVITDEDDQDDRL